MGKIANFYHNESNSTIVIVTLTGYVWYFVHTHKQSNSKFKFIFIFPQKEICFVYKLKHKVFNPT